MPYQPEIVVTPTQQYPQVELQSQGYPHTTWGQILGAPYITVSSKGIANGLSVYKNDGAMFGPDTLGTKTVGIKEAILHCFDNNGGKVLLKIGIYSISSTSINEYGNLINIPPNSGNNSISITIEGETSGMGWLGTGVNNNTSGVTIYVTSTAPTPPTGYYASIFGVDPYTGYSAYTNIVALHINNITIMQDMPASWTSYNFQFCQYVQIGFINAQVTDSSPPTVVPTNTNAIGVIPPMAYTDGIIADYILVSGHYAGILQGTEMAVLRLTVFFCNVAIGGPIPNPLSSTNYFAHSSTISFADLQNCPNYIGNSAYPIFGSSNTALIITLFAVSDAASTSVFATSSYIYAPTTADMPAGHNYDQVIIGYWLNYTATLVTIENYIVNQPLSMLFILRFGHTSDTYGTDTSAIGSPPASGTAYKNPFPFSVNVYLYGGTVTEIQITKILNNGTFTVLSNSTGLALSGQVYRLNPQDSIIITYTAAPTWVWLSDR